MKKQLFPLGATLFVLMAGVSMVTPLLPTYARTLGASGIWIGLIFSGLPMMRSLLSPIVGRMSDRAGKIKPFVSTGISIYAIASILFAESTRVIHLFVSRLFQGLGSSLVTPQVMAYISRIAPRGEESKYFGIINMIFFLGLGIGPFFGGALADLLGIKSAFYIMGILSFVALLIFVLLVKEIPQPKTRSKKRLVPFRLILRDKRILGIVFFRFALAITRAATLTFFPVLAALHGTSRSGIGFILTYQMLLLSFSQYPGGKIADRYGKFEALLAGGTIANIAFILFPFSPGMLWYLVLNTLMSVGGALSMPAAMGIISEIGREYGPATTMSLLDVAFSVGFAIGPVFSGVIYDILNISSVFYITGFIGFLGIGMLYICFKRY